MEPLFVSLLGGYAIARGEPPRELHLTSATQLLLAYLTLNRNVIHRREQLIGVFWPDVDEKRARNCLNTTVWRLRCRLEPDHDGREAYLVTRPGGEIYLNPAADLRLDVAAFLDAARSGLSTAERLPGRDRVQELQQAIHLYKGELLAGYFEDWILRERERLRYVHLQCLQQLMHHYHEQADDEKAIVCGQQLLEAEPLREDVHRTLMRLYVATGRRAQAVRQYEQCCQLLADELHIAPMPETLALYDQIVQAIPIAAAPLPRTAEAHLVNVLNQLARTVSTLSDMCVQVQDAIQQTLRLH